MTDEVEITTYAEAPRFEGVQLKDGTFYLLNGGGEPMYYLDEDSDRYATTAAFTQIIDPEEVESILLRKTGTYDKDAPLEDNFYIVSLADEQ